MGGAARQLDKTSDRGRRAQRIVVNHSIEADVVLVGAIPAVRSILQVVCQTTGMGFAAVARVTHDRWIACQTLDRVNFGLASGSELPVKTTLCDEIHASHEAIVIDDVSNDPVYANHHTPALYGLQSYISVPIMLADGTFFGTLCAIDSNPAKLSGTPLPETFRLFAQLIAGHIDDQRLLLQTQTLLSESRETSDLREQFIGVLGHDLQNPLAAFEAGTRLLLKEPQTPKSQSILALMEQTAQRMTKLVGHMLDLARGRLAGGIKIEPIDGTPLAATLDHVLAEIRASNPGRRIDAKYHIEQPVHVDHARVAQLFSNLLGNAIAYGSSEHPIVVRAAAQSGHFELSVANSGTPIESDTFNRLFLPFQRGQNDGKGLGLGLYIASQIARAHGGTLTAISDVQETRFTCRLPIKKAV